MDPLMTATCHICDGPCSVQQWVIWLTDDNGVTRKVAFVCSERCLERHDRSQWSAGHEYHEERVR